MFSIKFLNNSQDLNVLICHCSPCDVTDTHIDVDGEHAVVLVGVDHDVGHAVTSNSYALTGARAAGLGARDDVTVGTSGQASLRKQNVMLAIERCIAWMILFTYYYLDNFALTTYGMYMVRRVR